MTEYSTIADGRASRPSGADNMGRQRRGMSPKSSGGSASMISSNVNLVNTSTSGKRNKKQNGSADML